MADQEHDPFDNLLARLEPTLADSAARYDHLRFKMFKFFEWRRCNESWELADETIARLVKKVRSGVEVQCYSYVYEIAQYVLKEHLRALRKERDILSKLTTPAQVADPSSDCEKHCVERLDREKRQLLERYYSGKETSEELAGILGTTVQNLRLRIHRIKKKLEECYKDCLKGSGHR